MQCLKIEYEDIWIQIIRTKIGEIGAKSIERCETGN